MRALSVALNACLLMAAVAAADEMAPRYEETLDLIGLVEDATVLVEMEGVERVTLVSNADAMGESS